ncbi:MAG: hypothetical protein Ct9H300mP1_34110 [Planctomycetaceae bacterium]|nr:MAG: hypothetical protein Ct9H300mP1_34110 [Planctomycetaceae bacterium]
MPFFCLKQTGVVGGVVFLGRRSSRGIMAGASRITDSMITQNSRAFGAWIVFYQGGGRVVPGSTEDIRCHSAAIVVAVSGEASACR